VLPIEMYKELKNKRGASKLTHSRWKFLSVKSPPQRRLRIPVSKIGFLLKAPRTSILVGATTRMARMIITSANTNFRDLKTD
jgi:hypothetical protein